MKIDSTSLNVISAVNYGTISGMGQIRFQMEKLHLSDAKENLLLIFASMGGQGNPVLINTDFGTQTIVGKLEVNGPQNTTATDSKIKRVLGKYDNTTQQFRQN